MFLAVRFGGREERIGSFRRRKIEKEEPLLPHKLKSVPRKTGCKMRGTNRFLPTARNRKRGTDLPVSGKYVQNSGRQNERRNESVPSGGEKSTKRNRFSRIVGSASDVRGWHKDSNNEFWNFISKFEFVCGFSLRSGKISNTFAKSVGYLPMVWSTKK